MDSIYNNIMLDEDMFMDNTIPYIELTEEQRKQLDDGHVVSLLDGSIIVSIPMKVNEGG